MSSSKPFLVPKIIKGLVLVSQNIVIVRLLAVASKFCAVPSAIMNDYCVQIKKQPDY